MIEAGDITENLEKLKNLCDVIHILAFYGYSNWTKQLT